MTVPYAQRQINLIFQLGQGSFGGTGQNQITISGLRCHVQIEQANIPTPGQAMIRVYGLTLDQMNTLTTTGLYFGVRKNYVAVQAGDPQSGLTTIYNGTIYEAYPEFSEMPNSAFVILANPAAVIQVQPQRPVSFPGPTDAVQALTQILKPTGVSIENNSVSVMLTNPYFPGTAWQQALACIKAANVFGFFDPVKNVMAVWPKGSSRNNSSVPLISPQTGMIGYPEFQQNLIRVRTLFDPSLTGAGGFKVQIQSQLTAASGMATVFRTTHNISAQMPGGPWEMTLFAQPLNVAGKSSS